ncbi:MAG: type I pullulanase [Verrucomicrobiales bacterium]|nr:type I pullulanase [Verrucomicrobiales bacterium]
MTNWRQLKLTDGLCILLVWFILIVAGGLASGNALGASQEKLSLPMYRYPNEDLGATCSPQATTIKLWAPTAKSVSVALFDDAASPSFSSILMTRDDNGIWSAKVSGNLDGKYYLYDIVLPEVVAGRSNIFRVNDPYARGCSANTGRTLIYDLAGTNPEGWNQDQFVGLKNNADAILYEVHVRDFSIGGSSGVSAANRGKYTGMVEEGTKTPEGEKTGMDHLEELGVTHVHLLPVFDYAGGDERQKADKYTWYNWGYGPVLFNTPEGSYASDPDGTARQKEFKRMVQAFHRRHIGVVLDVVFNHTAGTGSSRDSIFDKIYPRYFYRTDASGKYADGTFCGNEFASEKPMARKFIVDSIKYWLTEYHVDGFRFDLMGIVDRDTMLEVCREARKINPNVIIYGEGWDMEYLLPPEKMMTQANVSGTGIAAFNDGIRDNIKGDAGNDAAAGFVQGAGPRYGGMDRFQLNIKGQGTGKNSENIAVHSPNETINYASAHDDHCLWDKLLLSATNVPEDLRVNMDKLAAGIVLTAQGVPFLHAGDEFLRSKKCVRNSYNDNDPRVNPINWELKAKHKEVFNFYQGMIALRKAHPAFRMTDKADVDKALDFANDTPDNLVEYVIRNNANGDSWKNILVICNGAGQSRDLTVTGDWIIVADDKRAGTEELQSAKDKIHVEPFSLVIAHTDGPYRLDQNFRSDKK